MATKPIGTIITGSLTDGLIMRIHHYTPLENLKTGKFVSIISSKYKFFSLITDLRLEVSHPDILLFPPTEDELLLKQALSIKDIYGTATLRPLVMLDSNYNVLPVKTVPPHFSQVFDANNQDITHIFGDEKDPSQRYFSIGSPLDMQAPLCLDLEKATERSNGIFGKTGTGKTFLTRLVLAGLIRNNKAVCIVFDMHSEYGLQARKEGNQEAFVKGLKTLFPDKVAIFSLDPASTQRRGGSPDMAIQLTYQSISVEDIVSLQAELNLHATAYEAAYLIYARYKKNWLGALLSSGDRLKELAQEVGAHPESISALYRKLKQIERLPFFVKSTKEFSEQDSTDNATIDRMIEYIDRGISIIIEFGNFTSSFCYLLIANIITRRIHTLYTQKTERFLGSHRKQDEPKKLMIVIEEAHKFLNSTAAHQTIFGTIAREMRKYYVSLLIVDQRPSGIDPEVLSQIGTKIIAQLNDEKDIAAVLMGTHNAHQLRTILASLDSKKQVLLLGHALAMPIVIESRNYDEAFYAAMATPQKSTEAIISELF
jgi:DNA helicase HerA-like ATPase